MRAKSFMKQAARVARALPCSLVGALLGSCMLACGGTLRRHGAVIELALPARWQQTSRVQALPFSAITFGHVILGSSHAELARLRAHELVHVRQYERLGILFFLAYPIASLVAWAQGQCPYAANRFEVEAACRRYDVPNPLESQRLKP